MPRPILSVIVPVFNTEAYLRECLDSVRGQTLRALEVLMIDDGSTDASPEILASYAREDSRFRAVRQQNAGVAAARNRGLEEARGEFVAFLDSDDRLPLDAYERLIKTAREDDAEIAVGLAESFNEKSRWIAASMRELERRAVRGTTLRASPFLAADASPCTKVFSRALVDRASLRFPVGVGLGEDHHFVARAYAEAAKLSVLPSVVYHYRARGGAGAASLTSTIDAKVFDDLIWVRTALGETLGAYPETRRFLDAAFLRSVDFRLMKFIRGSESEPRFQPLLAETLGKLRAALAGIERDLWMELPAPRSRLLLQAVIAGELELARLLCVEGLGPSFVGLADVRGMLQDPDFVRAMLVAQHETIMSQRAKAAAPNAKAALRRWVGKGRAQLPAGLRPRSARAVARDAKLLAARVSSSLKRRAGQVRELWLIGERLGNSVEDTGFQFFRYLRQEQPGIDAYFVTRRDAKGVEAAEALGNVLYYGTRDSYEAILEARVLAYSDSGRDFFHHWRRIAPHLRADAVGCFLQHGVIGTSGMGDYYSKASMLARGERVDLFVASTDAEQEIIETRLGFDPGEVIRTGLSRFDSLSSAPGDGESVLIVPTWRDWLRQRPQAEVAISEYYRSWQGLLSSPALHELLDEHGLRSRFWPHFAMGGHAKLFRSTHPRVQILDPSSDLLQAHIRQASLLITDYSSVGFDFAYQERPVIYYQFDSDRFFDRRGEAMMEEEAMIGPVVESAEGLLRCLEAHLAGGLRTQEPFAARQRAFFPRRDQQNSARIFEAIRAKLDA
ncbi:MAG: bifunctional glycosyltransferase family 2 protein/CDP-glycerol:glycerophosphate glycerophosphotransferase [Myxococcales bacterium]|nr:bifunctional glycosyltransferase family 2 protein/CDP-glycerol:glycerophosphate glycerophosphotransferase [Myxococcales bacterium]